MRNSKLISQMKSFAVSCKQSLLAFLHSSPHHWLRAVLCLGLTVYLIYLLNCFTTIPVKDYYFDIAAMSPDSIVPDIRIHVGDENVMNTYSGDYQAHGDSIYLVYNFYQAHQQVRMQRPSTGEVFHPAKSKVTPVMNTIYRRTKTNKKYNTLFSNAYHTNEKGIFFDPNFTCLYTRLYFNIVSSAPIGYKRGKQVYPLDSKEVLYTYGNEKEGWSNIICGVYPDSTIIGELSRKHSYFRANHALIRPKCEKNTSTNIPVCRDLVLKRQGLYKLSPRLFLLLSKENIAMKQYHFLVKTAGLDVYKISLHTRGGAVIQNNPSDELQVLSLHDTQITKKRPQEYFVAYHRDIWKRLETDFEETDLYVQIPENDALQYIRLFFITLLIGWLMVSFCRNIADGIYKTTGIKLYENWR